MKHAASGAWSMVAFGQRLRDHLRQPLDVTA